MVPFKQKAGCAPRAIEIERKRRLFAAQDIAVFKYSLVVFRLC